MGNLGASAILVCLLAPFWNAPAFANSSRPKILITAFDPFGGSPTNRSQNIASVIQDQLKSVADVEICVIPVEYDKGAKFAEKCFENMNPKPAMAMSLGEGGCAKAQLETAAHNLDSTFGFPDNGGEIRSNHPIDPAGPKSVGLESFVADMYCSASSYVRSQVVVSESPGGFVCNNTAYHLARYFQPLKIPYSFIHVPNSRCLGLGISYETGKIIADMIRSVPAIAISDEPPPRSSLASMCPRLPYEVKEIERISKLLDRSNEPEDVRDCHKEFFKRLHERLNTSWPPPPAGRTY